jgi:hypothetical protein
VNIPKAVSTTVLDEFNPMLVRAPQATLAISASEGLVRNLSGCDLVKFSIFAAYPVESMCTKRM